MITGLGTSERDHLICAMDEIRKGLADFSARISRGERVERHEFDEAICAMVEVGNALAIVFAEEVQS